MASLQELSKDDGIVPVLAALATDGAVIVHNFVETGTLQQFRDDMEAVADERPPGTLADSEVVRKFWGANTKRFTRLAHRSAAFVEILTDPLYLTVADAVLLPYASDYWMNTGQMMIIGPGEKAQWLHRDSDNWPRMCAPDPDGYEVTLSALFAISDFSAEVGATRVVPGSHLWSDYTRRAEPDEICQAVMPSGSALLYTGRVLHGGGANTTVDEWRYGLHVSYVLGWLTPEEASPLGASWGDVAHLSERAQRLLGWRCSAVNDAYAARLWTVDYEDVPLALGYEH
ncbi:MAG TPA: phytanoyl-CoA dioxygenase family protein [Ilumatobacteraceae bacterium]|nr:phytanoyl-CoA dioxygenase family protein [Ilumatobacteraceae bacterium]